MAWEERDYYRQQRGGGMFGGGGGGGGLMIPHPPKGSITFWLLIINIAVFFVDVVLTRVVGGYLLTGPGFRLGLQAIEAWGYFSFDTAIANFQIWRVLTFQFLHAGLFHLLGNAVGLFFFGHMAEQYFGSRRFLAFYLLCGVGGALAYVLMLFSGILVGSPAAPLIGASAGVFGVLVVAALTAPNAKVLLFFIIPIPLRVLVWGLLFIAAITVLGNENNAGGEAAHLGGAAVGYLLYCRASWLNWADGIGGDSHRGSATPVTDRFKSKMAQYQQKQQQTQQAEVDRILDKVRQNGMQSLSRKEKKTLNQATERQQRKG